MASSFLRIDHLWKSSAEGFIIDSCPPRRTWHVVSPSGSRPARPHTHTTATAFEAHRLSPLSPRALSRPSAMFEGCHPLVRGRIRFPPAPLSGPRRKPSTEGGAKLQVAEDRPQGRQDSVRRRERTSPPGFLSHNFTLASRLLPSLSLAWSWLPCVRDLVEEPATSTKAASIETPAAPDPSRSRYASKNSRIPRDIISFLINHRLANNQQPKPTFQRIPTKEGIVCWLLSPQRGSFHRLKPEPEIDFQFIISTGSFYVLLKHLIPLII